MFMFNLQNELHLEKRFSLLLGYLLNLLEWFK